MLVLYPNLNADALRGLSVFNVVLWIICSTLAVFIFLNLKSCGVICIFELLSGYNPSSILEFRSRRRIQRYRRTRFHFCWCLGRG